MVDKKDIYPYQRLSNQTKQRIKPNLLQLREPEQSGVGKLGAAIGQMFNWPSVLTIIVGFILARGVIINELWPFGSAWLAASTINNKRPAFGVFLAIAAGLWTVTRGADYWSTVAVLILLLLMLRSMEIELHRRWLTIPALVLVTNLVTKSCFILALSPTLYKEISILFESLMAGILTFVFMVAAELIRCQDNEGEFSLEEKACFVLLGASLIIGINDIHIYDFSLGNIVSRFGILLGAFLWGAGMGSAVGISLGVLPSLSQVFNPYTAGFYGLAGLLAGAFRAFGKIGVILGFMLGNLLLSFYLADGAAVMTSLLESAAAAILLILVPARWFAFIGGPAPWREPAEDGRDDSRSPGWLSFLRSDNNSGLRELPPEDKLDDPVLRDYTVTKLQELARVFNELARPFEQIAGTVTEEDQDNLMNLFNNLAGRVCQNCPVYRVCWENEFYKTYKAILSLFSLIETKGTLTADEIPPDIRRRCVRVKELVAGINYLFDTQKLNQYWQKKMAESREMVSAQIKGVAGIMEELAASMRQPAEPQPVLEKRLSKHLKKQGITFQTVAAYQFADGNLEVRLTRRACKEANECRGRILENVAACMGEQLMVQEEECFWRTGSDQCRFKLVPAWAYEVTTAFGQIAKEGNISGDSARVFNISDGKQLLILSDGMGVGERAARESQAVLQILEQLLQAGFDKGLAIKTVNSILSLRSSKESFATIDLAVIDLQSGLADFVKVGASASYIKRGSRVAVISAATLPAGILQTVEVETIQCDLRPGDILVMVTDGLVDSHPDPQEKDLWIKKALGGLRTDEPQEIVDWLLREAQKQSDGQIKDDMTVMVARVDTRYSSFE